MPARRVDRCATCGGLRPMTVTRTKHPDGRQTCELICTACSTAKPFGLCCPACGDYRLRQVYTRPVEGADMRVRECVHCGGRGRYVEAIVSNRV